MPEPKLNGSIDLLARAMRRVFTEAAKEGAEPVKNAVSSLNQDAGGGVQDTTATQPLTIREDQDEA